VFLQNFCNSLTCSHLSHTNCRTSKLPVFLVFGRRMIDIDALVNRLKSEFDAQPDAVPALFYDVRHAHVLDTTTFREALGKVLPRAIVSSINSDCWLPSTTFVDKQCDANNNCCNSKPSTCCSNDSNCSTKTNDNNCKQKLLSNDNNNNGGDDDDEKFSVAGRTLDLSSEMFKSSNDENDDDDDDDDDDDENNSKIDTTSWRSRLIDDFVPIFIGSEKGIDRLILCVFFC
jgi:hypothetical protein